MATTPDFPQALKRITLWLLIGTGVFLAVQAWMTRAGQAQVVLDGGTVALERRGDGHFHWPGSINGRRVEFLVDTGATRSAIPQALAERAGLVPEGRVQSMTAGGVVEGYLARATIELEGGVRAERLSVMVLPALPAPLLGMDILSRMPFSQSGGVLRFEVGAPPS